MILRLNYPVPFREMGHNYLPLCDVIIQISVFLQMLLLQNHRDFHLDKNNQIKANLNYIINIFIVLLDFSLTVKAASHECVIRTSQP